MPLTPGRNTNEKYALASPMTRIPEDDQPVRLVDVADDADHHAGDSTAYEHPEMGEETTASTSAGTGTNRILSRCQETPPAFKTSPTASSRPDISPGESTALVSFLATKLGKPVLVEGPAGVGKTELAKALAATSDRTLVRLQCYEGLDEAKALYEWNYRKQLLRIQAEADDTGWQDVQDDIFGEEFLLQRPLMTAIASESRSYC